MKESELQRRVKKAYQEVDGAQQVPSFDSLFIETSPRRHGVWPYVALAASLLVGVVYFSGLSKTPEPSDQLMAEVLSTTLWESPSDRWLMQTDRALLKPVPEYMEVPSVESELF